MHPLEKLRIEFVCGVTTDLAVDVPRSPRAFRHAQREVLAQLRDSEGWHVVVPERYAEPSEADRLTETVRLRTWDAASVGTTRLPVGFLRLIAIDPSRLTPPDEPDWVVDSAYVTLFADGAGVVTLSVDVAFDDPMPIATVRQELDRVVHGPLSDAATGLASEAAAALAAAVRRSHRAGQGDVQVRVVGRHQLIRIAAAPAAASVAALGAELCLLGRGDEFRDVCSDEDRFCFPGNGVSLEVTVQPGSSILLPVLQYYEYWIAATTGIDDRLHDEVVRLMGAAVPTDAEDELKDEARLLWYAHRDVLNALSPVHAAAWEGYARTWRISEVEQDFTEKIGALEELNRSIREALANRIAERTNALVTFLTALTLISIVTGVAAFVLSESRLTYPARAWLVVGAFLAAVALFIASVGPLATQRLARRRG